ncbi:MAG: ATP/GTP-binding protein [Archaeoglobaceae archaeon]
MRLIVIGPAGSGKSTFVKEFGNFLKEKDYEVKIVNLDPASEPIYTADVDVRNFVKTEELMRKFALGINGALLKSVEEMLKFSDEFKVSANFVLYDTPGQMELFIYSESGLELIRRISDKFTAGIFLLDSSMIQTPENLVSGILQNVVVMLRTSVPMITAVTKSDLFEVEIQEKIGELSSAKGVLAEIMEKFAPLVEYTTLRFRTIKISSVKKTGFQELFSLIQELFCVCGDLS